MSTCLYLKTHVCSTLPSSIPMKDWPNAAKVLLVRTYFNIPTQLSLKLQFRIVLSLSKLTDF